MRPLSLTILTLLVLGYSPNLLSQENFTDSIANLSRGALDRLTILHYKKRDTLRGVAAAKMLIKKSKEAEDFEFQSRGYHTLNLFEADFLKRKQYADSMYLSAKASKKNKPLCDAFYALANANYFLGDYEKSMEHLAKSYKLALQIDNSKKIRQIETRMAAIKNLASRYYEANRIYANELKKYDNKVFSKLDNKKQYLSLLLNTAQSYARMKQYDSSLVLSKKGMFLLENYPDEYYSDNFERVMATGLIGISKYDQGINLIKAKSKNITKGNQSSIFYYLGLAYEKKGNTPEAVGYYLKSDSLWSSGEAAVFEESKLAYRFLFDYFGKEKDSIKAGTYLQKYFKTDSLIAHRHNSISDRIHRLYDLPKLKDAQKRIDNRNRLMYGVISVLVLALLGALLLIRKQRKENRKQKAIVNSYLADGTALIAEPVRVDSSYQLKSYLAEDTRTRLITELHSFQNNKGYLETNITQHDLAKRLNTNHTNLYKVLKHDFNITFPNYLKKLRIENAINSLMEQPELLKYTIDGLAQEFGFTNPDTFSRSFKEVTKVKPSIFLSELKKKQQLSDNS